MQNSKPKTYNWRTYLADDLEVPAKVAALENGKDVREYLSELLRNNLPKVKVTP